MRVRSGTLDLDLDHPERATITLSLDPASIDTGYSARDDYIKGASFLETGQYPNLRFETTAIYPDKGQKAMVLGELDMHGVTKPVTIETELTQAPEADGAVRFAGATRLSRSDWGMTNLLTMVDDDVHIRFQLTAVPSP